LLFSFEPLEAVYQLVMGIPKVVINWPGVVYWGYFVVCWRLLRDEDVWERRTFFGSTVTLFDLVHVSLISEDVG
jgi:hypothetical protein